jgi:hypothetical protein
MELAFHEEFFKAANRYSDISRVFEVGAVEALEHGIGVIDALHIAGAWLAMCEVFVTTEAKSKPIFRTMLAEVVSIAAPQPNLPILGNILRR